MKKYFVTYEVTNFNKDFSYETTDFLTLKEIRTLFKNNYIEILKIQSCIIGENKTIIKNKDLKYLLLRFKKTKRSIINHKFNNGFYFTIRNKDKSITLYQKIELEKPSTWGKYKKVTLENHSLKNNSIKSVVEEWKTKYNLTKTK